MELIWLSWLVRSPQLVPQFAVSQQSAMLLVRSPQSVTSASNPGGDTYGVCRILDHQNTKAGSS
jgi:hypothetical protein